MTNILDISRTTLKSKNWMKLVQRRLFKYKLNKGTLFSNIYQYEPEALTIIKHFQEFNSVDKCILYNLYGWAELGEQLTCKDIQEGITFLNSKFCWPIIGKIAIDVPVEILLKNLNLFFSACLYSPGLFSQGYSLAKDKLSFIATGFYHGFGLPEEIYSFAKNLNIEEKMLFYNTFFQNAEKLKISFNDISFYGSSGNSLKEDDLPFIELLLKHNYIQNRHTNKIISFNSLMGGIPV